MKKTIIAALAVMIAASGTAPALAKPKLTGEAKLAKMLEGREAGKPVSCLPLGSGSDTTVIDKTAIVYRYGNTLYVNRPTNANALDSDDVMVTELRGSSTLCRLDTVKLHDRASHFYEGFVGLQDFVPYRKIASAR